MIKEYQISAFHLTKWLTDWLQDWLTDWLTNWLTNWLTDWRTVVLTYVWATLWWTVLPIHLTVWLNYLTTSSVITVQYTAPSLYYTWINSKSPDWISNRLVDKLTNWLTDSRSTDWQMTDWLRLTDWLTDNWLTDWQLTVWLTDGELTDWRTHWLADLLTDNGLSPDGWWTGKLTDWLIGK